MIIRASPNLTDFAILCASSCLRCPQDSFPNLPNQTLDYLKQKKTKAKKPLQSHCSTGILSSVHGILVLCPFSMHLPVLCEHTAELQRELRKNCHTCGYFTTLAAAQSSFCSCAENFTSFNKLLAGMIFRA